MYISQMFWCVCVFEFVFSDIFMCISQISPCMRCTHVSWLVLGSKGRINLVRVGFDQLFSCPKIDSINKSRNIQEMKNWQKWLSWGCIRSGIVHRYFLGLIWNWFCWQSFGRRTFKPPKRTKKPHHLDLSSDMFVKNLGQINSNRKGKTPTINSWIQKSSCQQVENWKHKCCFAAFHSEGNGLDWHESDLSLKLSKQIYKQTNLRMYKYISTGGQRVRLRREWSVFIHIVV